MSRITIVTDSTADLSQDLIEQYNIKVVPLTVHFGDQQYRDGVDIFPKEFYAKLASTSIMPSTSQPSPGDFVQAYEEVGKDSDVIISIHISSKISGTYQSAQMAKDMLPDQDIEVIDSKAASFLLGMIVLKAAEAVEQGKTKEEIVFLVQRLAQHSKILFVVDTLEYLQKNGRIGKASAFLGTVLSVKPILTLDNGAVAPAGKVRGRAKALETMVNMITNYVDAPNDLEIAIAHTMRDEDFIILKQMIKDSYGVDAVTIGDIGPVIGAHTGSGVLGVAFYSKQIIVG